MAYIFDTKLKESKSIYFSLTSIYGIGKSQSFYLSKKLGFSKNFKTINLLNNHIDLLTNTVIDLNLITNINKSLKKKKLLFFR